MTFYGLLVFIHIVAAIIGVGPGFILTFIVTKATTMTELRHAYLLRNRLHLLVMTGGIVMLITGIAMGCIHTYLFSEGWYIVSLILFLIALGLGPMALAPKSRPIKALLREHKGDMIPAAYQALAKKLFFYERLELTILFIIIVLMVLKPF